MCKRSWVEVVHAMLTSDQLVHANCHWDYLTPLKEEELNIFNLYFGHFYLRSKKQMFKLNILQSALDAGRTTLCCCARFFCGLECVESGGMCVCVWMGEEGVGGRKECSSSYYNLVARGTIGRWAGVQWRVSTGGIAVRAGSWGRWARGATV